MSATASMLEQSPDTRTRMRSRLLGIRPRTVANADFGRHRLDQPVISCGSSAILLFMNRS
jgi:hypothetical protein